ncbi:TIGR03899 family protein [Motilimonas eburnea]|uniref:TIGR03899 family protein n=1 Tax=Motilimonas eburnea TaxID=1737488 RepID=UPI001E3E3EDC|nr:TIGR03899 family protein [Motilimonas eburnea]MCE2571004.1 TIGR03899 family protein [Motilimonas eburnea]
MAESKPLVEVDQVKKDSHLFNSKQKTLQLARHYAIDHEIQANPDSNVLSRAKKRMAIELGQKQHNLEKILAQAYANCGEDDTASDVDPDWMHAFLSLAETISSKNMQTLWGKILAQEISTPASYSVKALETLKKMTQREAIIFQKLCQLSSTFSGDSSHKIITGFSRVANSFQIFSQSQSQKLSLGQFRFPYSNILLMADLGLLYQGELESGEMVAGQPLAIDYHGYTLSLVPNGKRIKLYYYKFTQAGDELSKLISCDALPEYVQALSQRLESDFQIHQNVNTKA